MYWRRLKKTIIPLLLIMAAAPLGIGQAAPVPTGSYVVDTTGYYVPDYFATPNWANSPPLAKFSAADALPPLGCTDVTSPTEKCIPVAVPDKTTYPGSDYYEIELVQYRERLHSGLPAVVLAGNSKMNPATTGGTLLRGYRQINTAGGNAQPHYLGPVIIAKKYDPNYAPDAPLPGVTGIPGEGGLNGRPVRIKFTNSLPSGAAGNLFVPVDTTIMGSGEFQINYDPATNAPISPVSGTFAQNRGSLHLHGGRTPWISDGTAHQWITPAGEPQTPASLPTPGYGKGASVEYVPDMWFLPNGTHVTACAGLTVCTAQPTATNNPGPGSQTYYYTNQQSSRLMFYHDHAWGITRLNVYVGEAAGYVITDAVEAALVGGGTVNGRTFTAGTIPDTNIPLIIQDKTFVHTDSVNGVPTMATDPTWAWGSNPAVPPTTRVATPVTGDLWWPHVYMPAQNPYVISGASDFGRWHYGPWFFPSTPTCGTNVGGELAVKPFCIDFGPVANEYYGIDAAQPPERPGTHNPSWGAEAFLDTMLVNGTAYPTLSVPAGPVRFRILNASHDRFLNLQMYRAASKLGPTTADEVGARIFTGAVTDLTEVSMVPAVATAGFPAGWPIEGREGGVPDPATRGPAFIQIGSEGGLLPAPVVLPNQPVVWNTDPTLFNVGNVLQQNEGGGTLFLGPAERADVIVDFSEFAGHTLIIYNDAPTAFPALVGQYDYYTGAPDRTDVGGYVTIPKGVGPNIRTVMQITVAGTQNSGPATPDSIGGAAGATRLATLQTAFATGATPGAFASGQDPIVVGQAAYGTTGNSAYNVAFQETSTFPGPTQGRLLGVSRISDGAISFQKVDGTLVTNYPMKPKAIHDEMGATFDDYGRMSAKLGLEMPFTNAQIANFILQNFVDPVTEIVRPDEIQIWRITHNGVDAHPIHFHLFDVQVLNRVGWDGFIRLPDANELGWKDTVRMHPLEDTIVALRPVTPKVPFALPNSYRPLNPATLLGSEEGFSQIDTTDGGNLVPAQVNKITNFGHEYTWHCHILSHEENDMMRPISLNVDQLLYVVNPGAGIWQWELGNLKQVGTTDATNMAASNGALYASLTGQGVWKWDGTNWSQITPNNPDAITASDTNVYADFGSSGVWKWSGTGTTWSQITPNNPDVIVASGSVLYADYGASGIWMWNGTTWSQVTPNNPDAMVASSTLLYADYGTSGIWMWNGTTWSQVTHNNPEAMAAAGAYLFADFGPSGIWRWDGTVWSQITPNNPDAMIASGSVLYADYGTSGIWKWEVSGWSQVSTTDPLIMAAGF
ncbi:MAG: multicopper oxidase domain-containing protein [Deltaproteobacteria bacterium]|nr:multicopper oxidase domain-containing protein [Deltaproteobacteria bacterium]